MLKTDGLVKIADTGFLQLWKDKKTGHSFIEGTESLTLLIYVKDSDEVIVIEQVREAMRTPENPSGEIMELIAGRFDNNQTILQLAVNEAREECGATIEEDQIEILNNGIPLALSSGSTSEKGYLAYAEIYSYQLESDRVFGLAGEHERIARHMVKVEDFAKMTYQEIRMMALSQWFLRTKWRGR